MINQSKKEVYKETEKYTDKNKVRHEKTGCSESNTDSLLEGKQAVLHAAVVKAE